MMNRPFDITYIWKAVPEILSGSGRNAAIFDRYDRDRGAFGLLGDLGKDQRSEMAAGNRP